MPLRQVRVVLLAWACALAPAACTREPPPRVPVPPGPKPTLALDNAADRPWRALDHLGDAVFSLPEVADPTTDTALASGGVMPLTGKWSDTHQKFGRMRIWSHPLPFACDMPRPNYAPLGARLFRRGVEVPFVGGLANPGRGGWFVEDGTVRMISLENPASWVEQPELRVDELAATLKRRVYAGSGLTPAEFVTMSATVGAVTRPGLLIPAPGRVEFTIMVPAGARLDLGASLLAHPLLGDQAGNGAVARVEVDGESVWKAVVAPGDGFADATADLSRYSGKQVTLAFVSDPNGNAEYDSVFFSAPAISAPAPASQTARHIVVVGIDTLRWDAMSLNGQTVEGRETTPEFDAWAQSAVVFDDAWAPAPRTRPSFRTALTGRYPYDAIASPTIAEMLDHQGFRTAGFVANVHLVPRFRFNDGFEQWYYENGARAEDQVTRSLKWLGEHQDEDTYTFVHLMDPHTYYNAPEPFGSRYTGGLSSKFVPEIFDRWQIIQLMRRKKLMDTDKQLIRGRYDGEVAYLSHSLNTLFDGLDALHGKTVTLVHSDHGEEFWDHGGYEHNHSLYSELVHALLVVRPPGGWGGGPHHVSAAVGLIDIVPTLLDLVGVTATRAGGGLLPLDGRSLRPFIDGGPAAGGAISEEALAAELHSRPLALGHLMFDKERWGVVFEDWKYILQIESGQEELYDLTTDAGEQHNRTGDAPAGRLDAMRQALSTATGWPIGPVWRLSMHGALDTFRVDFPGGSGAGVVDPEAGEETRANLEWGEKPNLLQSDLGELRPDGDGWIFRPMRAAGQTLWFGCAQTCPDGTITAANESSAPLTEGEILVGGMKLQASRGWMLRPTRTEAEALAVLPVISGSGDSAEMEQLKLLGYVAPD